MGRPRRDLDEPDPEFGAPPEPKCRCDGTGWVRVLPDYAEHLHPMPDPLPLDASDTDRRLHELRCTSIEVLRRSAVDSLYPCKVHRAQQFYRWARGHYAPDHDPSVCGVCQEEPERPKAGRKR